VQVFGWILAAVSVIVLAGLIFWYIKKGGREMWYAFLERKRNAREAQIEESKLAEGDRPSAV
jgi:sodium-dependent phosphate cotransporter